MPEKRADTLLHTMQNIEWFTLARAWDGLTDDDLERSTRRYTYRDERPSLGLLVAGPPGPETSGAAIVAAALNEVSHHGTQICVLRDLYRAVHR